jgi:hypothetical protein
MTEQLMDDLTNEEHEALLLMSEHAIAAPLSPAAQVVLDAVTPYPIHEAAIAAALRAAADQVVPPALEEEFNDRNQALPLKKMVQIRQKLLAIAAELEAL